MKTIFNSDFSEQNIGFVCPCKGCVKPKRHFNCHADCPLYLDFRKKIDEFNHHQVIEGQIERIGEPMKPVRKERSK